MPLSNSQYDEILREYNAKQIRNQHLAENRKKEVYAKDARLKEIDDAISSCSVTQARKLLNGDRAALAVLREEIKAYRKERLHILERLGCGEDYFVPDYDCPDCRDTGYIGDKRCHCFKQRAIDLVYTQSNIRNILQEENFQTFSYEYYSKIEINPSTGLSSLETMKNAVRTCHNFIDEFDRHFSNLFLYGDTGVGKTFLSNCVAKELLDQGHSVIYFTAFQLFDIFEKNTFRHKTDSDMVASHQNIFDCDLLIIDDLGTEMPNSFTISQLFLCLNERILRKKSTIISTNLPISQMAQTYSERTFSRITSNYVMIKLFGDDIRIQKKIG
ncbi:MAG: ATP-binding protein [Roseburia sp.]|nr:ATP-binding protein [Roseburia sp.]